MHPLAVSDRGDDDDDLVLLDEIKEPIASDAIAVQALQFPLEFLDVGTEEWIGTQLGIDDGVNLVVKFGIEFADLFAKLSGLCDVVFSGQRYSLPIWPPAFPAAGFA